MDKWEHHVDKEYNSNPKELYTRGEEGWELVSVIQFADNWRFYWKRKVQVDILEEVPSYNK